MEENKRTKPREALIDEVWRTVQLRRKSPADIYYDGDFDDEIFTVEKLREPILERHRFGVDTGENMDGFLNGTIGRFWRPSKKSGSLVIVFGTPSHGKSEFIETTLIWLAKFRQWKICLASFENMPPDAFMFRSLLPKWTGIPAEKLTETQIKNALDEMENYVVVLNPSEEKRSIDLLISQAQKVSQDRKENQGFAFLIDPWNEIPMVEKNSTETQFISESLSKLRTLSRSDNMVCIVVAHPTKIHPGPNAKTDADGNLVTPIRRPTLSDVSGSFSWRSKADFSFLIYRKIQPGGSQNEADFTLVKARFSDQGKLGSCKLTFDPVVGRFV